MALHNVSRSDAHDLIQHLETDIGLLVAQVKQKSVPLEDSMEAWIVIKLNARDMQARLNELKSGEEEVTMQADTELVRNLKTMKSLSDRLQKVETKIFRLSRLNDLQEKVWFIVYLTVCLLFTLLVIGLDISLLVADLKDWVHWIQLACFLVLFWALARMHPWVTAVYERCKGKATSQSEPLLQDPETGYKESKFTLWRHSLPALQSAP